MKISIKLNNQNSFQVTVPDNSTVDDLKIASLVALPPSADVNSKNAKIWFSGHKLEYNRLLSSYGITPENSSHCTVYLTSTESDPDCAILEEDEESSQNTTVDNSGDQIIQKKASSSSKSGRSKSRSKSKSKKCSFGTCTYSPLRMVGDCQFCQGKFCSKHRLLESHNCKGLKTCKDKCYERNALKLQSEQTVASKV